MLGSSIRYHRALKVLLSAEQAPDALLYSLMDTARSEFSCLIQLKHALQVILRFTIGT